MKNPISLSKARMLQRAFTLIELLVVIAIIAILAAILLPVLGRAKQKALQVQCLNNYKQLQLCYLMYIGDNNDDLAFNFVNDPTNNWIYGAAQTDYSTAGIQAGVLFQYNRQVLIYACPANTFTIKITTLPSSPMFHLNEIVPQTRTCSIDYQLGGGGGVTGPWTEQRGSSPTFESYYKSSQLKGTSQASVFVFDEEAETSLDDGEFGVYPLLSPMVNSWWNVPANRHNNGADFSFLDGHVEYFKWHGSAIAQNQNNTPLGTSGDVPGDGGSGSAPTSDDLPRVEAATPPFNP
jgi:prepilin-type N-terminal cleavage/methylation domain-containing protein/prepilin-type processing-associated H-X9-DG protein